MAETETEPHSRGGEDEFSRITRRLEAISRVAVLARAAMDMPDGRASRRLNARVGRMIARLQKTPR